jgi:hypothetical protein
VPFPVPYPDLLSPDLGLAGALAAAYAEAQLAFPASTVALRAASSLVQVDDSTTPTTYRHGGMRELETHYSASLLKVAALYAAYELRRTVNNTAASVAASTPGELFAGLSASLDHLISVASPAVSAAPGITEPMKVPQYSAVFAAIPLITGGFALEFTADFVSQLRLMIVRSSNEAAAQCIQRLGYSWINGTLAAGGFFDPTTNSGIWLAGTFTGSRPYVRIPSVNDGLVAQALTCRSLAKMYALLNERLLVDASSSDAMLALLAEAQFGPDAEPGWITRPEFASPGTSIAGTHTKIGLGPLKPENGGFDVASEGTILVQTDTGRAFIAVWQNGRSDDASLRAMTLIFDRSMKLFLGVP